MSRAWNGWYHCNGNTYGTWLRGSDLAFRERHHRIHVEGDYKNPPPKNKYNQLKWRSKGLMTQAPVHLTKKAQKIALDAFVASLVQDQIQVVAVAIDSHHFHALVKCPDANPRKWVGQAKGRSARTLLDRGLVTGRVWTVRFKATPVRDRAHQLNVARYIAAHDRRGATIWRCDTSSEV